jgi:hypothetical protein
MSSTSSAESNEAETQQTKKRKKKKKPSNIKSKRSRTTKSKKMKQKSDSGSSDSLGDIDSDERERIETQFDMYNDIYPLEDRPPALKKKSVVGRHSLNELMMYQTQIIEREKKENLGEEVFTRDTKTPKTRYKKMKDDGKKRLHIARWNRLPLAPPESYYAKTPTKRKAVIRNFPMEHYGVTGLVLEVTIGHLHTRSQGDLGQLREGHLQTRARR